MAWSVYQFYVVDETGVVLPGATVTVRDTLNVLAMIASDDAGTPMANPFQADEAGLARFYAQSGLYNIEATLGGATATFPNTPIGSARRADVGTGDTQVPTNLLGDLRWIKRTEAPILVAADTEAAIEWAGRLVRVTAQAAITVPDDAPVGFTFDVERATPDAVTFTLDGTDVFESTAVTPDPGKVVGITDQWGWASVAKMAAGRVAIVGQITDATP